MGVFRNIFIKSAKLVGRKLLTILNNTITNLRKVYVYFMVRYSLFCVWVWYETRFASDNIAWTDRHNGWPGVFSIQWQAINFCDWNIKCHIYDLVPTRLTLSYISLHLLWSFISFDCMLCYFEHYNDVIAGAMASQITSLTIVCLTVYSGADQRKHQSSASLTFVMGIHRWPLNSPHKSSVTRKMLTFDDVIINF